MPFLHATNAFVCAYDISADACKALELQATAAAVGDQRLLVTTDLDAVQAAGPYDLVVALFGVLSHIEGKRNRIDILSSIRSMLSRGGALLLTVPHALRRFPLHVSSGNHGGGNGGPPFPQAQGPRYFPFARPVVYRHYVQNEARPFPYYLFSRRELTWELSAAGFVLEVLESDSILPERRLVRRPALAPVDDLLCRLLPSWAGYGLRAVCRAGHLTIGSPRHRGGSPEGLAGLQGGIEVLDQDVQPFCGAGPACLLGRELVGRVADLLDGAVDLISG
jgi:hypothetical protein